MSNAAAREPLGLGARAVQVGFALFLIGGWFYLTSFGIVNKVVLPAPLSVIRELPKIVASRAFAIDLWTTLFEIVSAFSMSVFAGVALGYFISRSAVRIREYEPLLSAIYAVPMVLFYPLFVLLFGIGPASKIAVGTLIGFFPVVLGTIAGFRGVSKVHVAAARTWGASDWQMLRWVMLPSALPVIATGLRMGLILTMLTVLGSETLGSRVGLGYRMIALTEEMETAKTYGYILIILALAISLNLIATVFERKMQTRGEDR